MITHSLTVAVMSSFSTYVETSGRRMVLAGTASVPAYTLVINTPPSVTSSMLTRMSPHTSYAELSFMSHPGMANQNLQYFDGTLKLVYQDPETTCGLKGDKHRSASITFKCDHQSVGHSSGLELAAKDAEDCSYFFDWWTSLACLPFTVQECSIRDEKGNEYDLSRLTKTRGNYLIQGLYVINVCTTLVHESGEFLTFAGLD